MNLKLFFFIIIVCLSAAPLFAQQHPVIQWENSFGGNAEEWAEAIAQTTDSGYIVAGYTLSSMSGDVAFANHGGEDYWVIKLDRKGKLKWQNVYGGSGQEDADAVAQTRDGGFIVAGKSKSLDGDVRGNHDNGHYDAWILKLDSSGNMQWNHCFGGSSEDNAYAVAQTHDGGYLIAGASASSDGDVTSTNGLFDFWIVKLDSTGKLLWQRTYGGSQSDEAFALALTRDGGAVVVGVSGSEDYDAAKNFGGGGDYWIIKIDSVGKLLWQKNYGGSGYDQATAVATTADGGFFVAGYSNSTDSNITNNHGDFDYWVIRLDSAGKLLWQQSLGDSLGDYAKGIITTSDGGCIVAGYALFAHVDSVNNVNDDYDYWVVRLDSSGGIVWTKAFGGSLDDNASSIAKTFDGNCIIAGGSLSNNRDVSGNHGGINDRDFWIVKLEDSIKSAVDENPISTPNHNNACETIFNLHNSPNPFSNSTAIEFTTTAAERVRLDVADMLGRMIATVCDEPMAPGNHTKIFVAQNLPAGMYAFRLVTSSHSTRGLMTLTK